MVMELMLQNILNMTSTYIPEMIFGHLRTSAFIKNQVQMEGKSCAKISMNS